MARRGFHRAAWRTAADDAEAVAARPPSVRQREALELWPAGLAEKEAAARLGISQNTVHVYVKQLHRHYRVRSRGELLARWVGRDSPPPPTPRSAPAATPPRQPG